MNSKSTSAPLPWPGNSDKDKWTTQEESVGELWFSGGQSGRVFVEPQPPDENKAIVCRRQSDARRDERR